MKETTRVSHSGCSHRAVLVQSYVILVALIVSGMSNVQIEAHRFFEDLDYRNLSFPTSVCLAVKGLTKIRDLHLSPLF